MQTTHSLVFATIDGSIKKTNTNIIPTYQIVQAINPAWKWLAQQLLFQSWQDGYTGCIFANSGVKIDNTETHGKQHNG
ncbi:MAG: hypothetical protein KJ658_15100 [Proteobacteria bacterium]|nr:hypothetical protein [Pseudomonadota bacterium]